MSDVQSGHLRYHEIDIPARFIRQAMEHIEHSQSRYVTFIFTGEMTEDAVCAGVTTRLTDQRPKPRERTEEPKPAPKAREVTLETLTDEAVLEVIKAKGPLPTGEISAALGISSKNIPLRQKVWRMVTKLRHAKAVTTSGPAAGRSERWVATGRTAEMPLRAARKPKSTILRSEISEEMVLEQFQAGQETAKDVSDAIGIPPGDASARGKVTEHIRTLIHKNRLSKTGLTKNGGPVYELVREASATQNGEHDEQDAARMP